MSLYRDGAKMAEKLIASIHASVEVPFERVLFALSIPYVGETGAKKIARAVGDIDRLMSMSEAELMAIEDVGPNIARSIIEYFADDNNRRIIQRLRQAGLQFAVAQTDSASRTDLLQGKSIVISGTFSHYSRDKYKELIELNGGKNVSSISKKTDMVFAGENMGPAKLEKATKLGIPIIDEETFLKMIHLAD
jgi:DNA ligase (NAD+)